MPRSIVLVLGCIAFAGLVAAAVTYKLTPELPTPTELADQARRLSDELGLDKAETEKLLAGCNGIVEGYGRLWSGMVSARYEACLRDANLLK